MTDARTWQGIAITVLVLTGLVLLAGAGCVPASPTPTPTPTRTPKPTLTPTPTPTQTPSPTPTPAYPIAVGCAPEVPDGACARLRARVTESPTYFTWIDSPAGAQATLKVGTPEDDRLVGTWTYAVAAPFFTVTDEVSLEAVQATWAGNPTGPFIERPLMVAPETRDALSARWEPPAGETVQIVAASDLLTEAQTLDGWALVPFDQLAPQWKVLRINGMNPLEKRPAFDGPYPLTVSLVWESAAHPETQPWIAPDGARTFLNRDEQRMTVVAMTGVTAMTRATAQLMDAKGVTYPAQDVKPWFEDADLVHISNEVSFKPDCVAEGSGTLSFCSHDSYIGLLEAIGTNVIELTGNHLEDKGTQWVDHSLEMYRERGWHWFGGGATLATAIQPLKLEHNGNRIAFLGCNTVGPFAGEDSGGAAPCSSGFEREQAQIQSLREEGYLPIVTLQYLEAYEYAPSPPQIRDFRTLARAGAVMVQGSQAHQAQTMEFHDGAFVHYGLGNFFFDQMWSDGTRQEFVDRLTFYEGALIGIELHTAILEEYGRPRPMTVGDPAPEADRAQFLEMIFALRPSP
jgi:poly-gamma-glutamate capsule biosynthesis protein CapA/YwtB (metallophosphatase superfamily)